VREIAVFEKYITASVWESLSPIHFPEEQIYGNNGFFRGMSSDNLV
jgi:hypothetical protein